MFTSSFLGVLMQFRTALMSAMLAITNMECVCGYNRTMFGQFHNGRHGDGTKLHWRPFFVYTL